MYARSGSPNIDVEVFIREGYRFDIMSQGPNTTSDASKARILSAVETALCISTVTCEVRLLHERMAQNSTHLYSARENGGRALAEVNISLTHPQYVSAGYLPTANVFTPIAVSASRSRSAVAVESASQGAGALEDSIIRHVSLANNATIISATATGLHATVRLEHVADNSTSADALAPVLFDELTNSTDLTLALDALLFGHQIGLESLMVEYVHDVKGLIVLNESVASDSVLLTQALAGGMVASQTADTPQEFDVQVAEALSASVSTLVAGALATTIIATTASAAAAGAAAGAAASAAGSAAGSAVGGSAGGAAGGSASSAVSSLTPLLFGAQRFVISSGVATNVSSLQTGLAESMAWTTGDFGLTFQRPHRGADGDRRLSEDGEAGAAAPRRTALDRLSSVIAVMLAILLVITAVHAYVIHLWRHKVNHRYYEAKHNPKLFLLHTRDATRSRALKRDRIRFSERSTIEGEEGRRSSQHKSAKPRLSVMRLTRKSADRHNGDVNEGTHAEEVKPIRSLDSAMSKLRFTPFPSALVFPGFFILAIQVFSTGITSQAVQVVANEDECRLAPTGCRALGMGSLLFILAYEVLTISVVIHFHRHFRADCWQAASRPLEVNMVKDPLYRLLSRIRSLALPKRYPNRVVGRPRGMFVRPPSLVREPSRTERILAHPRQFFYPNAAEALDGYGYCLWARSGGDSLAALMFEMVLLAASLTLAVLGGLKSVLIPGSKAAIAQMGAVLAVQILVVVYASLVKPSADRIMNLLIMTQFSLEAVGTSMLMAWTLRPDLATTDSQTRAFLISVLAMIAPIVQRFYDAVIVNSFKAVNGGFTWKGLFFSTIGLVVFFPTMFVRLGSCDCCNSSIAVKASEMASDDINKLATKMANEGLFKQVEDGIAEIASRAFWQAHIDAEYRRESAQEKVIAAARLLQARWRARRAAQQRDALADVESQAGPRQWETGRERPGFVWLEVQMANADAADRAQNENRAYCGGAIGCERPSRPRARSSRALHGDFGTAVADAPRRPSTYVKAYYEHARNGAMDPSRPMPRWDPKKLAWVT